MFTFYAMLKMIIENPLQAEASIRAEPEALHLRNGAGETMLHYFAIEDDLPRVTWLHGLGARLDTADHFGATALMHAVQLDYRELTEYLLAQGADVDAKTINGDTAFSYAVMDSKVEMTHRLLRQCHQPIQFYFDPINAQELVLRSCSELQRMVVALGLIDPYGAHPDGMCASPDLL